MLVVFQKKRYSKQLSTILRTFYNIIAKAIFFLVLIFLHFFNVFYMFELILLSDVGNFF